MSRHITATVLEAAACFDPVTRRAYVFGGWNNDDFDFGVMALSGAVAQLGGRVPAPTVLKHQLPHSHIQAPTATFKHQLPHSHMQAPTATFKHQLLHSHMQTPTATNLPGATTAS